jgi:hypothetical protein
MCCAYKKTHIFSGSLGITPEGKTNRKSIMVEDLILCQVNEQKEQINKYLEKTMAFISGFEDPNK